MEKLPLENGRNWLQRLKEESWEAELLISTVAIFGTIQLFQVIDWLTNSFINILLPEQYKIGYFIVFFGLLGIGILVSMFVIHFILRAYWVGLVGLNSVFPDYGLKDSAYSQIYTNKMLSILPKLKTTIKEVDELCSVIFSAAFYILVIYIYSSLITSISLFVFNFLAQYISTNILLIPVYLLFAGFIIIQIFIVIANIKAFRNFTYIQLGYFQVVKWSSIIILGPLYKHMLQISMTFGSNFKKKKLLIFLIISFVIVGFVISIYKVPETNIFYLINHDQYFDETRVYSEFYQSNSPGQEFLLSPQIETDIIVSNVTQLFIPIYKYESKLIENVYGNHKDDPMKSRKE